MTTKAKRNELFFESARLCDFPNVFAFVRLVRLSGDFAESVAIMTVGTIDSENDQRTIIDAHGKSNADLIRMAIKEFDGYVADERSKWGQ